MDISKISLKVSARDSAEASKATTNLQERLIGNIERIELRREKEDRNTLDPGTVLIAILGTKFAFELAQTIHDWLLRNHSAEITIGKNGTIAGKNLSIEQIQELVRVALANKDG